MAGRFFVKQDHQGPPGFAHGGVIATALDEAMSLLLHAEGVLALTGSARGRAAGSRRRWARSCASRPAWRAGRGERRLELSARALAEDGAELARARGVFVTRGRMRLAGNQREALESALLPRTCTRQPPRGAVVAPALAGQAGGR